MGFNPSCVLRFSTVVSCLSTSLSLWVGVASRTRTRIRSAPVFLSLTFREHNTHRNDGLRTRERLENRVQQQLYNDPLRDSIEYLQLEDDETAMRIRVRGRNGEPLSVDDARRIDEELNRVLRAFLTWDKKPPQLAVTLAAPGDWIATGPQEREDEELGGNQPGSCDDPSGSWFHSDRVPDFLVPPEATGPQEHEEEKRQERHWQWEWERYRQVKEDLGITCLGELTKIHDSRRHIAISNEELKKRVKEAYASWSEFKKDYVRDIIHKMQIAMDVYDSQVPDLLEPTEFLSPSLGVQEAECLDELTKIDDSRRQIMTSSEELKKRVKEADASKSESKKDYVRDIVHKMQIAMDVYQSQVPDLIEPTNADELSRLWNDDPEVIKSMNGSTNANQIMTGALERTWCVPALSQEREVENKEVDAEKEAEVGLPEYRTVVRNTFLEFADEQGDCSDPRRPQSCPPRLRGADSTSKDGTHTNQDWVP